MLEAREDKGRRIGSPGAEGRVWSRTASSAMSGDASPGNKAQGWKEGYWEDEAWCHDKAVSVEDKVRER